MLGARCELMKRQVPGSNELGQNYRLPTDQRTIYFEQHRLRTESRPGSGILIVRHRESTHIPFESPDLGERQSGMQLTRGVAFSS